MSHEETINGATVNVQWARRHLIPLRTESEAADHVIDSLEACLREFELAVGPPYQGQEKKLTRAVVSTLGGALREVNTIDDPKARLARNEISKALRTLDTGEARWAAIK